ncbi:HD domain-containing protein [Lentzea sp. NPDC059081]|uniref:HD domain-containing protein n=1 Tax=Lentzea sp. NPDC059081 TaxID=3346719 RepID=UPI0036A87D70
MTTLLSDLPDVLGPWPRTPATVAAVEFIGEHEPDHLVNHSIRSYFYGRHLGDLAGTEYDDEILFLATVLHDIGLTEEANGSQRFEVDGADRAARFVLDQGLGDAAAETVWDAIALHTSPGIANRKSAEIALAHAGIGADILAVGADRLDDALTAAAHARYPRLDLANRLTADVAGQIRRNPAKHVLFSFADAALRHHFPEVPQPTFRELAARGWG